MRKQFTHHNEYEIALGNLFEKCPKTVMAAIAVSTLTCGGDWLDTAKERFMHEWAILFMNGIVSQKPSDYDKWLNWEE